jgi:hypothetical protein
MLTQRQLKEMFNYNPETGLFQRRQYAPRTIMEPYAGSFNKALGYCTLFIDGKNVYAHRAAWLYMTGEWPQHQIDHANMNRADNRWCNLREATRSANHANKNKMPFNSSGLKGVGWHKQVGKWRARITIDGKENSLGLFDCPAAASFAYQIAADKAFGQHARPF